MSELPAGDARDVVRHGGQVVAVVVPIEEYRQLRQAMQEQQVNEEFDAARAGYWEIQALDHTAVSSATILTAVRSGYGGRLRPNGRRRSSSASCLSRLQRARVWRTQVWAAICTASQGLPSL